MWLNPSNATTPVGWIPEPSFRGTFSILSGCVATLLICVLSALHLDVPEKDFSPWSQRLRKAKWVLVGMFAPSFLTTAAFAEYRVAASLMSEAKRLMSVKHPRGRFDLEIEPHPNIPEGGMTSRHPWTLVHAFYASTGGFVVDFSDHSIPNFRALTPMGIVHLMEHNPGSIPNLSVVDILDKSKTNSLSKVMALVQILWFCAQCIARLTQNLPISLLELNTFVHGVFAVVTCALWWHKPSDVAVPTVIQVQPEQFVKDNKPLDGSSRSRTHMPVLFLDPWSRGDEFAHEDEVAAGLTGVLAVFYGAIHVAA
ncbi:uncharacterized protein STEHIDRAFT_163252 [Stereum hirsutum FP-91666 SS1]|uniref:Uncharacterized protein n=1 Tax=Stereum hirsutum (strain FP-91666) TaxID=721885 RepID=R7RXB9_STEHR|nr:uncharacterized protein STEHIDRAFT_163252 [Stereum hirsutum FP-91666 SS1]EIM79999.1 hypothetical protein STEHIDRAFT_163252 [Stereum hirsutum FP-91666 SS1]